jgi:Bifunctional DNA primase/polymerase, N-terminal/AAA domain
VLAVADTVSAALWLAERRLHVFDIDHPELPRCVGVRTREHDPVTCSERGKHPCGKWSTAATVDRERVTAMFAGTTRNIGIACGPSGLVVVDEDVPGDLARYAETIGQTIPVTFTVRTGKGSHFYFRQPAGVTLTNNEGALRSYGINVRGVGGYVVGPGSLHANGTAYAPVDVQAPIVPCPPWLVAALTGKVTSPGDPDDVFALPTGPADHSWWRDVDVIHHPNRHNALFAAAGWCRAMGIARDDAVTVVRDVWRRCCPGTCCRDDQGNIAKPYTWDQAAARLDDAYERYEAGRDLPARRDDESDNEYERRAQHERQVAAKLHELRVVDEARHRLAVEHRGHVERPELLTLRDRLARPRTPTRWRIDEWQPAGSRVVLAAQFKAGKTTLVGNLVRSLVDGDDWLHKHEVTPVAGTVTLLDFEMGADQLDDWLRDQRIRNDDRIHVEPMRGRATAFDLLDDRVLAEWVKLLQDRGTGYLALDCLRPILDALGLDEHRDAGRFFVALDRLLVDAGIADALVVHHMGHDGERSRGDSRIRDWPDVEWRLVRLDDQPGSARYISAYGRDVDVAESELLYDPTGRHLTVIGGSRRDAAIRAALRDVTRVLEDSGEPLNGRAIELALEGSEHTRATIRRAVALGIRREVIHPQPGPHRSTLHTVAKPAAMSDSSAPESGGALENQDQTIIGVRHDDE